MEIIHFMMKHRQQANDEMYIVHANFEYILFISRGENVRFSGENMIIILKASQYFDFCVSVGLAFHINIYSCSTHNFCFQTKKK